MDNRKLKKALIKTLDDFSPLLGVLLIILVGAIIVGSFLLIGMWTVPVGLVIIMGLKFWSNYLDA